jgi:hypothetical protein
MTKIRRNLFFALLALMALGTTATASAQRPSFNDPPPPSRTVIYVTGQGLFYDSIVLGTLPPNGPFQKLEMDGPPPSGLQTEFGPGDPGYVGGRWWVDVNDNDVMDDEDAYFLCPLLAPGYPTA